MIQERRNHDDRGGDGDLFPIANLTSPAVFVHAEKETEDEKQLPRRGDEGVVFEWNEVDALEHEGQLGRTVDAE